MRNRFLAVVLLLAVSGVAADTPPDLKLTPEIPNRTLPYPKRSHAQHKLSFACRSTDGATLAVGMRIRGENDLRIKSIKIPADPLFQTVVLGLDTDFRLADAFWEIEEITFRVEEGAAEVREVRVASQAELSGAAKFLVIPPENRALPAEHADLCRVYFDFDNLDAVPHFNGAPDPVPYQGFRDRLLEGSESVIRRVDTPEEADVIVYSRARAGVNPAVVTELNKGKRLVLYGLPADPEIAALAPIRLTPLTHTDFPERGKLKILAEEHYLFSDALPRPGADYGRYFKAEATDGGRVLATNERGEPAVVEKGNVLHFAGGVGTALLDNGPWYDLTLLRAVLGNDPAKRERLREAGETRRSRERQQETALINSLPGRTGDHWHVGVSRDNFGRFGWEIGEGLLTARLENDLTVMNGEQFFRFEFSEKRPEFPIVDWQVSIVEGKITLPTGAEDPTRLWSGEGCVEYTADIVFDPAWRKRKLSFEVDKGIDDTDVVTLNGVLIGRTDTDTPNYWVAPRRYEIPEEIVRWNEPNRLSVKVANLRGDAGFGSRPLLRVGEEQETLPTLAVTRADWVGKEYRIRSGESDDRVILSLLTPFTRFELSRENILMTLEERTAQYAAWSTPRGIRIVPLSGDFFDRERDGEWNAPWLLLFRKNWSRGRPLLLVFEKQPEKLEALRNGNYVTGIEFHRKGGLGTIAAGWPWGVTPVRADRWVKGLPPETVEKIHQSLDLALHFPVGCDEIFRIDREKQQIEVRNRFRFRPLVTRWNTPTRPFVFLPPLIGLALREKLNIVEVPGEPTDFAINATHGPLLGKRGTDTIGYLLPLPREREFTPVNVLADPELHRLMDDAAAQGFHWSWGGLGVNELTPEFPNGKKPYPDNTNIGFFGWHLGLGSALQGYCFLNPENRARLGARLGNRYLAPFELYQYKAFSRFREEPFSGIRYTILFPSTRELSTNFTPGYGSTLFFADCNEAATFMAWIARQLGDLHGHAGFIRSNWSALREGMRFSWCMNDWSYLSGSLSDNGGGAWIDMLNAEYAGMIAFAGLARIAGDSETVDQSLYRAARRAIPTLVRFRAADYLKSSRPDLDLQDVIVVGFHESGIKYFQTPLSPKDGNFVKGYYFLDFSRGVPGPTLDLYRQYVMPEYRKYMDHQVMPVVTTTGGETLLKASGLREPIFFAGGEWPFRKWVDTIYAQNKTALSHDVWGIELAAFFSPILWRQYGRISIAEASGIDLRSADYDPGTGTLHMRLTADQGASLAIAADLPVKEVQINNRTVTLSGRQELIHLPVDGETREINIQFQ